MTGHPENFLINLAVLKVNWDEKRDILTNFMPLVGYAISKLEHDIVSTEELKSTIDQVAQFHIPSGALELLIRRASRGPYNFVRRESHAFRRNNTSSAKIAFEEYREIAKSLFDELSARFQDFCDEHFPSDHGDETAHAFYEILFDVAPRVIQSSTLFLDDELALDVSSLRFRAASFVQDAVDNNRPYVAVIESFFQGAIIAESFYYTSPESVSSRFRDVKVYYDTRLVSYILGYSVNPEVAGAQELHALVTDTKARCAIFDHTFKELEGIFQAALHRRRVGQQLTFRPGDTFDYFVQKAFSVSDIELEIARLPERLAELGIRIDAHPAYTIELGIAENLLSDKISEEISYINPEALRVDIASLTSIYRLRRGRRQNYLESCKAIFITTNKDLARASTKFFNKEYGTSDAPICMNDHVFCMLVWLKTVDKKKGIPKNILVANSLAALQPNFDLWEKYIREANRLRTRGDLKERDYELLAHSLEARQALMYVTSGDERAFTTGSVTQVLERARNAILEESAAELSRTNEDLLEQKRKTSAALEKIGEKDQQIEVMIERLAKSMFFFCTTLVVFGIAAGQYFVLGLNPQGYLSSINRFADVFSIETVAYLVWLLLIGVGIANWVFGWSFLKPLRRISLSAANIVLGKRDKYITNKD
jgi:hypothetical protein